LSVLPAETLHRFAATVCRITLDVKDIDPIALLGVLRSGARGVAGRSVNFNLLLSMVTMLGSILGHHCPLRFLSASPDVFLL